MLGSGWSGADILVAFIFADEGAQKVKNDTWSVKSIASSGE